MNPKRLRQQFVRFKIGGLMAFFLAAVMIVSVIGLGILLWYELTDPERLEPQRDSVDRSISLLGERSGCNSFAKISDLT
jgi:hypothetical protein